MSSALIAEFLESRHYECFGLIIEFLIQIKNITNIDIYVPKFNNDIFLQDWINFFQLNFKDIVIIRLIHSLGPDKRGYQVLFYVTSEEYHDFKQSMKNVLTNDTYGIAHHMDSRGHKDHVDDTSFNIFTLSKAFQYNPIPLDFKLRIDKESWLRTNFTVAETEHFFKGIDYFVCGNIESLNLDKINSVMAKRNKRCLVMSRKIITKKSNIVGYRMAPTKILIYCLLKLSGIFIPKEDSMYHKGQISGIIHLCASFNCRLLVPSHIYIMQKLAKYPYIKPFLSDVDLLSKI
jgi:hypothetical protein